MARLDNSTRQSFLDQMGKQRGGQGFTGEQFKRFNQDQKSFAAGFPDFAKMGQQPAPVQADQPNGLTIVKPLPQQQGQLGGGVGQPSGGQLLGGQQSFDSNQRSEFNNWMGQQRGGQGFTGEQFQQYQNNPDAFIAQSGWTPGSSAPTQQAQPAGQGQNASKPTTIVPPQGVTGGGQVQQPNQNQHSQDEWQGAFNSSYGQPNFNAGLDINLDGKIDFNDYQQYNANGGQKNIYLNRNNNGVYVDENGNPIGVTQPGNDPRDDQVFGGGPRPQPGLGAPGAGGGGIIPGGQPGGNTGGGGLPGQQPGGGQPGGSPVSGMTIDDIFADPRFANIFGQGGFQGINDRVGGVQTGIGQDIAGLGDQLGGRFTDLNTAIGSGFGGVNDNLGSIARGIGNGFNDVTGAIGDVGSQLGDRFNGIGNDISNRFGDLNTGLDNRFNGLQSGIDSQFRGLGDRFGDLDEGQRNIQDLLGTGAGSLQSRIGQEIGGVNNNINDRFNSLNGGIAGVNTNIANRFDGLGNDISNRFNNQDERFNSLDTGIDDIRGDITGLGDNITGLTGNVDARYNDIQGLINALGGQFGNLAGDVNSRTQIGDLLKNFTGEQFEDPSIYGTVEGAIKNRLSGDVADDPRVQSQLADLDKSQADRKNQRIEDLKRMGINADDGNYFSEGDELSEQFNRERLNVLANGENLRTADFGTGLNLGNSQGDLDVNQARINLDKFLGTGDLGVREKEADARIKSIDESIKQAQQRRDDDFLSDLFGTAAKFLPFLL